MKHTTGNPLRSSKASLAILAIAGIALTSCTPASGAVAAMGETPEFGDAVHFDGSSSIDGWSLPPSGSDADEHKIVKAQHPDPYFKDACYFSRTVEYLPAGYAPRGDEHITKQYIYTMGAAFKDTSPEMKTISVKTDSGTIEMLESTFQYEDGESGKTTVQLAARALADVRTSGVEVKNAPDSIYTENPGEGVPLVLLKADCTDGQAVSQKDWDALMGATVIALDSPIVETAKVIDTGTPITNPLDNEIGPEAPETSPSEAPVSSPSAPLEGE